MKKKCVLKLWQRSLRGIWLLVAVGLTGCVSQITYTATPAIQKDMNEAYEVTIRPQCNVNCNAFDLEVTNKSNEEIQIDWARTYFLSNDERYGGFSFPHTAFTTLKERRPMPPTLIAKGEKFSERVLPNTLVYFQGAKFGEWKYYNMPEGKNGISITIQKGEQRFVSEVLVEIAHQGK